MVKKIKEDPYVLITMKYHLISPLFGCMCVYYCHVGSCIQMDFKGTVSNFL